MSEERASRTLCAWTEVELRAGVGFDCRTPMELRYDTADPCVVGLAFWLPGDARVRWNVSRDLLREGLERPVGEGDVRVCPVEPGQSGAPVDDDGGEGAGGFDGADTGAYGRAVCVVLRSPADEFALVVKVAALEPFLMRTGLLVPFGEEFSEAGVGLELERWLGPGDVRPA
ncbi:SsgA family sporulation/cell division regulator [Streptomyces sp. H27-D2]|uniref:SsgA family sporulation/cell division regulator n=1 Tax=Streptomyces sp. H27-D2 TaxID=3046304 RepID=UPI002DB714EF|nr:SsgA family sporulation/cell division regulator [Streptomyces sp. H27-D2]MEC4015249.1 SsgA family sporulation/cell division regulator [Streptomyces sp. H27-D2]